jgi:hypothetical protein
MSDWSNAAVPERINLWTLAAQPYQSLIGQPFATGSGTWGAANQAIYLPFVLPWRYPVRRVFWGNGGLASGNVDVGIYTINGGRIWSNGGVAQAGPTSVQYLTPASPLILPSGRYYFAMAMNNNAGQMMGCNADSKVRAVGFYQQASAYPLPAQATFAPWTSNFIVPIAGLMASASGI